MADFVVIIVWLLKHTVRMSTHLAIQSIVVYYFLCIWSIYHTEGQLYVRSLHAF